MRHNYAPIVIGLLVLVSLGLSAIAPHDRTTWILEIFPLIIAAPILLYTYRGFPLTTLLYTLVGVFALVMICGGYYTYARVPLGFWLQDWMNLSRNPYDKIGHFMQGCVPALAAREILIRRGYLSSTKMTSFLSICVALAVSACYELIEWWAALILGQGADEFLGSQGDPWDTQSDMFLALLGAIVSCVFLSPLHDSQLAALRVSSSSENTR